MRMELAFNKLFVAALATLPFIIGLSAEPAAASADSAEQQISDRGRGGHRSPSRADRHGSHGSHGGRHHRSHDSGHHRHHDKNWERNNWNRNWYYYNTPNNYPYPYYYYYSPEPSGITIKLGS